MKHLRKIDDFLNESKESEMLKLMNRAMREMPGSARQKAIIKELNRLRVENGLKPLAESVNEEVADGLLSDVEDEEKNVVFDIDFEVEDEDGRTLDDDPEETGDFPGDERARPPKIRKKQREANSVKAKVSRELLGPESQLRPVINKIFLKVQKEIKKEAVKQGVPVGRINLDKLTIKR